MARGREGSEWGRTSLIAFILWADFRAQFAKGKQPKPISQREFIPEYLRPEESQGELPPIGMEALKAIFGKRRKKKK